MPIGWPQRFLGERIMKRQVMSIRLVLLSGWLTREVIKRKEPYKKYSVPQIVGTVGFDESHRLKLPSNNPFGTKLEILINGCLERNPKDRPTFEFIVRELVVIRKEFEEIGWLIRKDDL